MDETLYRRLRHCAKEPLRSDHARGELDVFTAARRGGEMNHRVDAIEREGKIGAHAKVGGEDLYVASPCRHSRSRTDDCADAMAALKQFFHDEAPKKSAGSGDQRLQSLNSD
jgi:hypothetical protein